MSVSGPFFEAGVPLLHRGIQKGVEDVGERGAELLRPLFTPGHGLLTGELQRSVDWSKEGEFEAVFGTNATHGPFVEYGTDRYPGQHQVRQAKQRVEREAREIVAGEIRKQRI